MGLTFTLAATGHGLGVQMVRTATNVVGARPLLRGVFHAAMVPVALVAGVVLALSARHGVPRVTAVVYAATGVALFAVSAAYHRGRWSPRTRLFMRRLDHSMIFLFVVGTDAAVALVALPPTPAAVLLSVVCAGATAGIVLVWRRGVGGPVSVLYALLGAAGLLALPGVMSRGVTAAPLLVVGLASYAAGALVNRANRPNPWPRVFGHHEVFHLLTVAAAAVQYVAVFRLAAAPG